MRDAGIVRNRAKIVGTIAGAQRLAGDPGSGRASRDFLWGFVDGRPMQNDRREPGATSGRDRRCRARSRRRCKAEGFNFVGPTIVYAFMQAVGMVNDHLVGCFRHAEVRGARRALAHDADASGSAARLAAHAVGPAARPPRPLAARHRDRGHRARPRARGALERADQRRAHLLGRAALAPGRGDRGAHRAASSTRPARLAVLLHDAPEYVIGDMISPFKAAIGDTYKDVEARLSRAIYLRFGLPARALRRADASAQACRPARRLPRGDPPGGLRARGSAQVLRPARSPCPMRSTPRSRHGRSRPHKRAISSVSRR